jgi:cellulose synthase/poly-beta-1,6-N-acetylglucosamine synthase-like glycosyltransferase
MKIKWSKWKNNIPAQPLVSVIIPTKDRPEMLQEAVNSVLNQSYSYVEAVVINDAGCDVSHNLESFKFE